MYMYNYVFVLFCFVLFFLRAVQIFEIAFQRNWCWTFIATFQAFNKNETWGLAPGLSQDIRQF